MSLILLFLASFLAEQEEDLILEPGRNAYLLKEPQAVDGSLYFDTLGLDYRIEEGILYLASPPGESLRVKVRYLSLADTLSEQVSVHKPREEPDFGIADTVKRKADIPPAEELDITGAKTFSVSVGNSGVSSVDQGLTVDVKGSIRRVNVGAHLTDEEGVFVPEGTTQRIQEFDRIGVRLSQQAWSLGLGDVDLSHPVPGYGEIQRRLQGGIGQVELGGFRARGGFGIQGSRRRTQVIHPADGKQGPYQIGEADALEPLVPGSEEVYLDGELMERGSRKDYTIDYSTGELTFTNLHRLEAISRIEVSYTYSGADYQANNQLLDVGYGPLEGFYYREADSRNHLYHTWNQEQQAVLDTASEGEVVVPGGTYVGENQGSYELEDGHYTYVGPGAGSYQVSFRRLEGEGGYVLDADSGFFRWVGADSGDYLPEILTTLPQRQEALYLSYAEDFGRWQVGMSGIGSRQSPNLYNDDLSFLGHSHSLSAGYRGEIIEISAEHRLSLPRTWTPARTEEALAAQRWNLDSLPSAYNRQRASIQLEPLDELEWEVEAGHLFTDLHRFRGAGKVKAWFFSGWGDWLASRQRVEADLEPRLWIFTPRVGFRFENYPQDSVPRRYLRPLLGLGVTPLPELNLGAHASRRIDQTLSGTWQDTLYYDRLGGKAGWQGEALSMSVDAGVERATPLGDWPAQEWQAFYGDAYADYLPSPKLRFYAALSQHTTTSRSRIVEYIPVEPGTGGYSRDPETGEYLPDDEGNYERVVRTDEGAEPEVERNAGLGTDLNFKLASLWAAFDYSQSPTSYSFTTSARLTLLPQEKIINLIAEPSYTDQSFPSWGRAQENLISWSTDAELRSRVHPDYLLRLKGSYAEEERFRETQPLRSSREITASLAPVLNLWLEAEPQIGVGEFSATESYYYPELEEVVIRSAWAGADAEKRFEQFKVNAGFLLTQRQPNVAELPYRIAQERPGGFHPGWNAGVQYYIGKGVSARLDYQGEVFPDRRGLENTLELSAAMYF